MSELTNEQIIGVRDTVKQNLLPAEVFPDKVIDIVVQKFVDREVEANRANHEEEITMGSAQTLEQKEREMSDQIVMCMTGDLDDMGVTYVLAFGGFLVVNGEF